MVLVRRRLFRSAHLATQADRINRFGINEVSLRVRFRLPFLGMRNSYFSIPSVGASVMTCLGKFSVFCRVSARKTR